MATRLVALGKKEAKFHSVLFKIDNTGFSHPEEVAAAGLIPWFPKTAPLEEYEEDQDLIRKQRIEDELADNG